MARLNRFLLGISMAVVCLMGFTGCELGTGIPSGPERLVIVAPSDWQAALAPYMQLKMQEGLDVQLVDPKDAMTGSSDTWALNLRKTLLALSPSYVFLVGDATVIPTFFNCGSVDWSPWTSVSCIYSDMYYATPEGTDLNATLLPLPRFVVGRLQAPGLDDVKNYVAKAQKYYAQAVSPKTARRSFLLEDRVYDATDWFFRSYGPELQGTTEADWAINTGTVKDATQLLSTVKEATTSDLETAVNTGYDFLMYYGHGFSGGFDSGDFTVGTLKFTNDTPVPLFWAIGCETALGAPNPPWYPYIDASGTYRTFASWDPKSTGLITPDEMHGIDALQTSETVENNNMSRLFTSRDTHGAMVYLGETVVSGPDDALMRAFLRQLGGAYTSVNVGATIGGTWLRAAENLTNRSHFYFFQLVGDPSTRLLAR